MQKMTWFRLSLASAVALAATTGVLVAGCSDDDTVTPSTGKDAGKDTGPGTTDGGSDTGPAADAGDSGPVVTNYPKLSLVHAGGNIGTVSFCMGVTTGASTTFALDDVFPVNGDGGLSTGLPPGAGGPLKVDPSRASLIPTLDITPYAIPSTVVTTGGDAGTGSKSCKVLVGDTNAPNPGVIKLNTIAKGTLKAGNSYIGAVIGCPGNAEGSVAKCGADWTAATGNVKIALFQVDKTTAVAAGNTGVQFLHLSPAAESLTIPTADGGTAQPFAGGVLPAAVKPAPAAPDAGSDPDAGDAAAPDAGSDIVIPLSGATKYAGFPANQGAPLPNALKDLPGISGPAGAVSWKISLYTALGAVGPAVVDVPMTSVVAASLGVTVTDAGVAINPPGLAYVQDGKAYTLVAVGDPTVSQPGTGKPNPGANFFRLILLQNDPNTTP